MSTTPRDTLRAALDPKSVAIVGASDNPNKIGGSRGHVTGVAGRLRGARQATAPRKVIGTTRVSRPERSRRPSWYAAVARGHVTGAAGRLRVARQATAPREVIGTTRVSRPERSSGPSWYAAVARGHVTGAAGRLRGARTGRRTMGTTCARHSRRHCG